MRELLLTLFGLFPLVGFGEGITNGQYVIIFHISDMGFHQEVSITNCWWTPNLPCMHYDVVIEKNGSLKKFDRGRQVVRGIVYNGEFKFVIPCADFTKVDSYMFEGHNKGKDGKFEGSGDVSFPGPNAGRNAFHFRMEKVDPNKSGAANAALPRR